MGKLPRVEDGYPRELYEIRMAAFRLKFNEQELAAARSHFATWVKEASKNHTLAEIGQAASDGGHNLTRQRISQIKKGK